MNKKMIIYSISRIMVFFACLMIIPIFVSVYYNESFQVTSAFLKSLTLTLLIFLPLTRIKPKNKLIYNKEGFIITSSIWLLMAFFGGLPLYLSRQIPSIADAYFEMSSGFSTTGASIITDLSLISNSILFWRSFSHFIGGMGVLVLALAILPEISPSSVHAMRAEVPGPQFGKLLPTLKKSARILYIIYLALTLVLIIALVLAKMPLFDAINHAMATAGTGGFGMKNGSIAYYKSPAIEIILSVGMLVFGINFNLYYLALIGRAKDAIKSEELKAYLLIILIATTTIVFNIAPSYKSFLTALKDAFFAVSSIITTTGFVTADFDLWPSLSKYVLVMIMFVGACAGSTAGGIKVSRIVISSKALINDIGRAINPNRKIPLLFDKKALESNTEKSVLRYIVLYFTLFGLMLLVLSFSDFDFETNFSAIAATFNNVGPGLKLVGPVRNYFGYSSFHKIFLSLVMITGRLEIIPMLVIFSPSTWRRG